MLLLFEEFVYRPCSNESKILLWEVYHCIEQHIRPSEARDVYLDYCRKGIEKTAIQEVWKTDLDIFLLARDFTTFLIWTDVFS